MSAECCGSSQNRIGTVCDHRRGRSRALSGHSSIRARLGLSSKPVKALPLNSKRYAVVIGVDQYADTQITTLGGASNDARALANALIDYAGFPAEQVTVLASDQPAERQPTRGNILRRLSNLAAVIPSDGLLLLSFAGHGMERGGHAFLLPSDAQVSNDVELLEETAINVTQIKRGLKESALHRCCWFWMHVATIRSVERTRTTP